MKKASLMVLLPICGGLVIGCADDPVLEPSPSVFWALDVAPYETVLFTAAPGNTVQLTIKAYDQRGTRIPDPGVASYSSSAPELVEVSSSGLLTALALGRAEITTALTVGGVTHTDSMVVYVHERVAAPIGSYNLTAPVTRFDPAWGDLTAAVYTGVLTLQQDSRYAPGIGGTYAGVSFIGPDGGFWVGSGSITSSFESDGTPAIILGRGAFGFTLFPERLELGPVIRGTFFMGGHISGPFTAVLATAP